MFLPHSLLKLFSALSLCIAFAGCGQQAASELKLVSGEPVAEGTMPATIFMAGCTAAKIGPRHFLTAAHCVIDFDKKALLSDFQPGATLNIYYGVNLHGTQATRVNVIASLVHHSYLERLKTASALAMQVSGLDSISDLAIVIVSEATDHIAEAKVSGDVHFGDSIEIGGYGCRVFPFEVKEPVIAKGAPSIDNSLYSANVQISQVLASVINIKDANISICNGDSGGPAYRAGPGPLLEIVGVNSYFFPGTKVNVSTLVRLDNNGTFNIKDCIEEALHKDIKPAESIYPQTMCSAAIDE